MERIARSCGILLPMTALPSPYGIGTMGQSAYAFVDFLAASGQKYWQLLPVGPTGCGDSPYQSFSTFAGNPYLIDLDLLIAEGLLQKEEVRACDFGSDPRYVDYGRIYAERLCLLLLAAKRGLARLDEAFCAFCQQTRWLADFSLFMALKERYEKRSWQEWPAAVRLRDPDTLAKLKDELQEQIACFCYIQYLFAKQWSALQAYAHAQGIRLIGDLPIYVALDSADVWAEPQFFQLNADLRPRAVAGVPPDFFTETGQLWGNPLYDWEALQVDGYAWWLRRLDATAQRFDVIRFDHFRGLESYWSVPFGAKTAAAGCWEKGPGICFVRMLQQWFPALVLIAEDLGVLTPAVKDMLQQSGLPGMKVLEFAFIPGEQSEYMPHAYPQHCVCYIGTHDNDTALGWQASAPEEAAFAAKYLGIAAEEDFAYGMIRSCLGSVADLSILQMQDLLSLASESRMNVPGTTYGNWRWRLLRGEASPGLAAELAAITKMYGR